MENIKNRIRELREDRDLRQIDVATSTGIDQKTLSNYETGRTNPDSYAILRLASFFGVTTDYLLGYSSSCVNSSEDISDIIENIETELSEIKRFLSK